MISGLEYHWKLWRLNSRKKRIDKHFRALKAKFEEEGALGAHLGALNHAHWRQIRLVEEEIAHLTTRRLVDQASKYNVPIPDEYWEVTPLSMRRQLTMKATNELRAAIRKEQNERWAFWELRAKIVIMVASAIAGAIGAIAGLMAFWRKIAGRSGVRGCDVSLKRACLSQICIR
jgi:hypothetical protein